MTDQPAADLYQAALQAHVCDNETGPPEQLTLAMLHIGEDSPRTAPT
jgi:hypothetical protein